MSQAPFRIPKSVLDTARMKLSKEKMAEAEVVEDSSITPAIPHTRSQPETSEACQSPHSPHASEPLAHSRANSGPVASSTGPNPGLHDVHGPSGSTQGLISCPTPNSPFPFNKASPAPPTAPTPALATIQSPVVHLSSPPAGTATCLAPCFNPRPVQSTTPHPVQGTGRLIQTSLQFPSSAKKAPSPLTTPISTAQSTPKSSSTNKTTTSNPIPRSAQVTKPQAPKVKNRILRGFRQRGWADGLREDILSRSVPAYAEAWKQGRNEENEEWAAICNDFNSRVPWDYPDNEELPADTNVSGPVNPPDVGHLTAEEKEERRKTIKSRNNAIRRWLKTRAEDYNRRNSTRVVTNKDASGSVTTKTTVTKAVNSILQPKLKVPKLLTPVQVFWKMEKDTVSQAAADTLTELRPAALLAGQEPPNSDISFHANIAAQLFSLLDAEKVREYERLALEIKQQRLEEAKLERERALNVETFQQNLVEVIGPILQNAAKQAGYNFVAFFYGPMVKKSGDHGVEALQYGRTEHTNMTFSQHCDEELWLQFQEALLSHSSDTFIDVEELGDTDSVTGELAPPSLHEDSLHPLDHDAAPLQDDALDSSLTNEERLPNHDISPRTEDSAPNILDVSTSRVDNIPLPLDDMIPLPDNFLRNNDIFSSRDGTSHPPHDDIPPQGRDTTALAGCDTFTFQEDDTVPVANNTISFSPADDTIMDTSDDHHSPTPNIRATSTSPNGNLPLADNTLDAHSSADTSTLKRRLDDIQPLLKSSLDSSNDIISHKRPRLVSHSSQDCAPAAPSATESAMTLDAPSQDLPTDSSNELPVDAPAHHIPTEAPATPMTTKSLVTVDVLSQNLLILPPKSDIVMTDVSTERESSAVPIHETSHVDKASDISRDRNHGTVKPLSMSCPEVESKKTKWFTDAWIDATPEGLEEMEYASCLTGWHQLESCNAFQDNVRGFLTNRLCPEEIRVWMRKKTAPDFTKWDGQDFGKRLCTWWNTNQPDSRAALGVWHTIPLDDFKAIDGLLEAPDKKWRHFQVPGRNGFCLMLIGISWWWRSARKSSEDLVLWRRLVNDVSFMMSLVERILLGL